MQLRVASACSTGAISAVGLSGSVTCRPTVGNEYGSNTAATTLGASATQVATQSLAAGSSYLVMAYPHVVISGTAGAPQRVEVACTLSVPAGTGTPPPANPTTTTKTLAVDLAADGHSQAGIHPARATGGVLDQHPAGDGQLHRHADAVHAGPDRRGRHHDQRDPDGQQQLIPSQGAAAGLGTGCRGRPRASGAEVSRGEGCRVRPRTERASR